MNAQEKHQLTETAATILSGLLASGHYTDRSEVYPRHSNCPSYRPEALVDAIFLAQRLQTLCEKQGQATPQNRDLDLSPA